MAVISYKCPGCGAPLTYDPNSEKTSCEYCFNAFNLEELEEYNQKLLAQENAEAQAEASPDQAADQGQVPDSLKGYNCGSCGAEVVTDETTSATYCYYCHNPVILSDRLSGAFRPQKIIPFSFDRKSAEAKFLEWAKKKTFVPKSFYSDSQLEKMTGLYLPFWLADATAKVDIAGTGINKRIWREGDTEYTENSYYDFNRQGDLNLKNMSELALTKIEPQLINSIAAYNEDQAKDFSMLYLSGFFSENYDLDKEAVTPTMETKAEQYVENLISDALADYDEVEYRHKEVDAKLDNWNYALFPAWVLTYNYSGHTYVYAINGQTGTAHGELPVDKAKLGIFSGIVFLIVVTLVLLGGYFIW